MGMVRNGQDLIDHGTLKPGEFHKWGDELSRLNDFCLFIV